MQLWLNAFQYHQTKEQFHNKKHNDSGLVHDLDLISVEMGFLVAFCFNVKVLIGVKHLKRQCTSCRQSHVTGRNTLFTISGLDCKIVIDVWYCVPMTRRIFSCFILFYTSVRQ